MNTVILGTIASLIAGLATGVGALPVLVTLKFSQRFQGMLLGIGGGVMLAATAFSLILPGIKFATQQGYSQGIAGLMVSFGILLGGLVISWLHDHFPYEHFFPEKGGNPLKQNFSQIWLFVLAITLHNFPEGLAVGVGFGAEDIHQGLTIATGIGLQNLPEGLVVAIALRELQYSVWSALGIAFLTGLVEPIGGLIGVTIVSMAQYFLPWAMAFAAGAMLFVIIAEIIPEIEQKNREQAGTWGVILGFVIMMFMDIVLSA